MPADRFFETADLDANVSGSPAATPKRLSRSVRNLRANFKSIQDRQRHTSRIDIDEVIGLKDRERSRDTPTKKRITLSPLRKTMKTITPKRERDDGGSEGDFTAPVPERTPTSKRIARKAVRLPDEKDSIEEIDPPSGPEHSI